MDGTSPVASFWAVLLCVVLRGRILASIGAMKFDCATRFRASYCTEYEDFQDRGVVVDIQQQIIRRGVTSDIRYVGRIVRDFANPEYEPFLALVSFCTVPFFSLIVQESRRKLKEIGLPGTEPLTLEAEKICARSRNSLKFFEDKKPGSSDDGIAKQLAYFKNEVLAKHSAHFLGNTWLPIARFAETDLGFFGYDGKLMSTTHAASFHIGTEPTRLLQSGGGEYISRIMEEYGSYFGALGASTNVDGDTFVSHLELSKLDRLRNTRAEPYYRRVFNGSKTLAINGVLTDFQAMMNFVDSIVPLGADPADLEYTVFKIRYLMLYQVLSSLRLLRNDPGYSLSSQSRGILDRMLGTSEARTILSESGHPFRNTLMHYNLDSRVSESAVDFRQPLFGLVHACFQLHNFPSFSALVDKCVRETAAALNEWSST